jgi:hypothetical protein
VIDVMDENDASKTLEVVLLLYITKKVLDKIDDKTWNKLLDSLKRKVV